MYSLKSINKAEIKDRGTVFFVKSPVTAERTHKAMSAAIGPLVRIDGEIYKALGFDMRMPGTPVSIGEPIGILVGNIERDKR